MKKILLLALFAFVGVFAITACQPSPEQAGEEFCAALTQLNEVTPLAQALTAEANIAQMVQISVSYQDAWKNVTEAAEKMDNPEVSAALAPFNEAFTSIPAVTQETSEVVARASIDTMTEVATQAYDALYPMSCE